MKPTKLHLAALLAVCMAVLVQGQTGPNPAPALFQQMVGTWNVRQRMWPAADGAAVVLPAAVAHRRMIGGAFLEESMERPAGSKEERFTRIAYVNYNAVNQQFEYFSLDTRAPQMMIEKSFEGGIKGKMDGQGVTTLYGGSFVAPRWGKGRRDGDRSR